MMQTDGMALGVIGEHPQADHSAHHTKVRSHKRQQIEYRLYTVLLFPLTLMAVCARRVLRPAQPFAAVPHRSFFGEVMELNRSTVPWIFMGR